MNDFLSPYGRPSDRLNAIKGLLGGYTGESSVLSQMGDYLNSSLGLGNIKSIAPMQGTQGTTYMVTTNDGQQYAMTAPGTRQGDGAYVARPENLDAGKFVMGESFGGGADNAGALSDAPARFAGDWQGQLDNTIYLSKYTDGMSLPSVTFDPDAYADNGLKDALPLLAIAAPAILGMAAPGLFGGAASSLEGLTGGAALDAGVAAGAAQSLGGTTLGDIALNSYANAAANGFNGFGAELVGSLPSYTGTAAELAADGLGGVNSFGGQSGIPGIDFEVPQGDLEALMDSPAGGGGTTADWWKQAISPSSNYSVTDLIRTAIPAEWLPTGNVSDKLLEKSLGLLGQGQQQPTGGLLAGGGSSRTPISPYAVNPVAFRQSQYAKIFGE